MKLQHTRGTWINPQNGKILEKEELQDKIQSNRVILLGETHTNMEIHRWQLAVLSSICSYSTKISVGFEMFPSRLNSILAEWTEGQILEKKEFLEKVEWDFVWKYDPNLYFPLFDFCRQNEIPMLGLNCRRELVSEVGKLGWENIPTEQWEGLTPSKPALLGYIDYLTRITNQGEMPTKIPAERFVRAQQTWDRAFACNIAARIEEDPTQKIVGIIGRGHLEYGYGTPYQLKDLGVQDVLVLLPTEKSEFTLKEVQGISDGIFRIDKIKEFES